MHAGVSRKPGGVWQAHAMWTSRTLLVAGAALALGVVATGAMSTAQAQSAPAVQRWEYWAAPVQGAISSKRFHEKNKAFLDSAGAKGWELVSVDTSVFYFKRPATTP